MIKSFACKETEKIFSGCFSKKLPRDIQGIAERKLVMLHYAKTLDDLRIPPANRPERQEARATQHPHQQTMAHLFHLAGRRNPPG
jgi:proteic killer suppression protein